MKERIIIKTYNATYSTKKEQNRGLSSSLCINYQTASGLLATSNLTNACSLTPVVWT